MYLHFTLLNIIRKNEKKKKKKKKKSHGSFNGTIMLTGN